MQVSRLRDIGFAEWDPIGVLAPGEPWHGDACADEYDGYLLAVVGLLQNGGAEREAADYLVWVETANMGLDPTPGTRARAERTVRAIAAYLAIL